MKGLVILFGLVLVVGVVGVWLLHAELSADPGALIGLAFGNVQDDMIEMHVVVGMGHEPPRLDDRTGAPLWDEWFDEHYDLRADTGEKVSLRRMGFSSLITQYEARNPEFFLQAKLRAGVSYTFDYMPFRYEARRYRYSFTAPGAGTPFERRHFEPLGDE